MSLFNVVLVRPQIPNNTGNIGCMCVATGSSLHLVRPLGFDTSEKACRRAGLDYWPRLGVQEYASWEAFQELQSAPRWYFTTKSRRPVYDAPLKPNDWFVFGNETQGLPDNVFHANPDRLLTLPMASGERSLNLATAVCAVLYAGIGQGLQAGWLTLDEVGRLNLPATQK